MDKRDLHAGDVVQINPTHDPIFGGHFMVVTEPKSWGAQGYCLTFPSVTGETHSVVTYKGLAYYRCKFENMDFIGRAEWIHINEDKESKND